MEASAPDFWNDQEKARANIAASNTLKSVLDPLLQVGKDLEEAGLYVEIAEAESEASERAKAAAEVEHLLNRSEKGLDKLRLQSLLGGEMDSHNAYLELHAGAGGTESCDWADMLFRMYSRYAERHGYEMQVLDCLPGDEAGIKSITFHISGSFAYGYLKGERGVHRLVRISPFDSNARRHTSFVAMTVTPEVDDDIEIEINDADLRVDTYRASGAGGQHVNKTDSAIRITHLPTRIIVQCQAERSQHKNRATAMKMLKARLYELEEDKKRKEMEKFYGEKGEIAWGRQIRSYVLQPYTMVKDHRTNFEMGNVQAVLDGQIDDFIEAYLTHASQA